ncbi:hypothetical protein Rt10032_c02g0890 [Rhodotorula toruloides]|uniref:Alpha-ketoglutarate-dependent dioxygenase AlkB-like domain-containing protein n=1 Tax=Rhodotorula toruloides TaxID=5286 RepID=A0A511K949_RHOTO|nr:hypothetical protein Rt10032_c02g0890 [Rhodotorula toruloides]
METQADEPARLLKKDKKRSKAKKRLAPRDDEEYDDKHDAAIVRRSKKRDRKSRVGSQADLTPHAASTLPNTLGHGRLPRANGDRPRTKRPRPSEADILRSSVPEPTLDLAGFTRRTVKFLDLSATSSALPPIAPLVGDNDALNPDFDENERRKERLKEKKRKKQSRESAGLSRDFFACSAILASDDDKPGTRSSKRWRGSAVLSNGSPLAPASSASTVHLIGDAAATPADPSPASRRVSTVEGEELGESEANGSSRSNRQVAELSRDTWGVPSDSLADDGQHKTSTSKRLRLAEPAAADSTNADVAALVAESSAALPLGVDPPPIPSPGVVRVEEAERKKARRKERKTERKKSKNRSGGMKRETAELRRDFFSVSDDAIAQESESSMRGLRRRRDPTMTVSPYGPAVASTSAAPIASSKDLLVVANADDTVSNDALASQPSFPLPKRSTRQRRPPSRFAYDPDLYTLVRKAEIHEADEVRTRLKRAFAASAPSASSANDVPSQLGEATIQQVPMARSSTTLTSITSLDLPRPPIPQLRRVQPLSSAHLPFPPTTAEDLAPPPASVPTVLVKKTQKARKPVPIVPTDPSTSLEIAPVASTNGSVSSTPAVGPAPKKASKQSQAAKARIRHSALDSRASWVEPEQNLTLTKDGRPPIWCKGRQELCETLSYFRSYQGGHYDSQERCLGYLLDGFGSANDVCTDKGKVVISHGGGCSEVVPNTSAPSSSKATSSSSIKTANASYIYRLKASQTRDNLRLRALFNCLETETPVVLLAGAGWSFFPELSSLGSKIDEDGEEVDKVRYAVLGHYLVTDIWPEGEPIESDVAAPMGKDKPPGHFVRFKVRFEWVPSQGKPWFGDHIGDRTSSKQATPEPSSPASDAASVDSGFVDITQPIAEQESTSEGVVTCETCQQTHRRIYQENVTCYDEACRNFFLIDGEMHHPSSLTYQPSLLVPSDLPLNSLVPQPLFPRTLQSLSGNLAVADHSAEAWRGFGCTACGRLSSRADWTKLKCAGCSAEGNAMGKAFTIEDLRAEERLAATKLGKIPLSDYKPGQPVFVVPSMRVRAILHIPGWEGYTVEMLPPMTSEDDGPSASKEGGVGRALAHHLWPVEHEECDGADVLFAKYQGAEAGELFRRNKLSRHHAVGGLLCQQFTFNAGEHYRNAITAATYPFPPATSTSSSGDSPPFDVDITYAPECAREARNHLDTVVQLLVGPDRMTDFNEILSVAYMTGGKMNYHDDGERGLGPYVASLSLGSDALMTFRAKGKKKTRAFGGGAGRTGKKAPAATATEEAVEEEEEGDGKKADRGKRIVCKMRLRHGDVMVMEGEEMQRLFEHKVEPEGLRYAATARFVGPDHLNPAPKARSKPSPTGSLFAYKDKMAFASSTLALSNVGASTSKPVYTIPPASRKPAGESGWLSYVQQKDTQLFPSAMPTVAHQSASSSGRATRSKPTLIKPSPISPDEWISRISSANLPPLPPEASRSSLPSLSGAVAAPQPIRIVSATLPPRPPVPLPSLNPLATHIPIRMSQPTPAAPITMLGIPLRATQPPSHVRHAIERRQAGVLAQSRADMTAPSFPLCVAPTLSVYPPMRRPL